MLLYNSQFVYNNLHPTLEEVQRLDFLNRDLVEIYDPIPLSVPTTLGEHHGKRVLDAKLAASHSEPEGFKDFSTKPQTEILIKVGHISDTLVVPHSKRRKTISLEKNQSMYKNGRNLHHLIPSCLKINI